MKIELNIQLDLPESFEDYPDDELKQLIFDTYVNYATTSHLKDALEWSGNDSGFSKRISENHRMWSDICRKATFNITK